MNMPDNPDYCRISRRVFAVVYDGCLLIAVLFLATALLLPVTGGQAVSSGNIFYALYLISVSGLYFIWQWHKGGQTLGMKAWHIHIVNADQSRPGWGRLCLRFLFALLSSLVCGLGFFYAVFDRQHKTLHDLASKTYLVVIK